METSTAPAPLRTSRARQTLAKKQHVLDVARAEFVRHGYRATTMDAIAQLSGVSKRSLYLWHEDKPALFKACLIDGARRIPPLPYDPEGAIDVGLRDFGVALLQEFTRPTTIGMGMLLVREAQEFPELADLARRNRDEYMIRPLAHHLHRTGLAGSDAVAAADLLMSMILVPVHNHLLFGDAVPSEAYFQAHVVQAIATFLHGRTAAGTPA